MRRAQPASCACSTGHDWGHASRIICFSSSKILHSAFACLRLCPGGEYFRLWMVLEGRRIAPGASRGRKVRTPQGTTPRNPSPYDWDTRGRTVSRRFDGECHRKQTATSGSREPGVVMVKRCGKSAPREAQATRHGKPRRVQDQIGNPGAARSGAAKAAGFRVLVAETNDSLRRKAQTEIGLQPFQNHNAEKQGEN